MNLIKKILALAAALCVPLCFVGCNSNRGTYVAGDFVFNDNEEVGITIIEGLSEEGCQKEVLFVPKKINNLLVKGIYKAYLFNQKPADFSGSKVKKIYLPANLHIENNFHKTKMILYEMYFDNNIYSDVGGIAYIPFFGNESYFERFSDTCKPANIEYRLNYNTDYNGGLHFIDDFDYGSKITFIPDDPIREGYTFGGWYTEEECKTKWDFENNTLPELKTDENGEPVYQGTILYAKWTQN